MAESDLVIGRGLRAGHTLRSVLADAARPAPAGVPDDVPVFMASPEVLTAVCGRPKLRDPIGCFARPALPDAASLLTNARAIAVLENVTNPNNMGVIMRAAAGLGIEAVLLDPTCCDPLYRRSVRASMGEVFALPHARLEAFPAALSMVTDAGFRILAMTPDAEITLASLSFDPDDRVAVMVGAEGPGLSAETLAWVSDRVKIPMAAEVDSLNVAVAAGIAFHAVGVGR